MGKLGGNWDTRFMLIEESGMWKVCVDSFGSPAPIGQRLSKKLPLPDYPIYATSELGGIELIKQWREWDKQNQPKRSKNAKRSR